MSSSREIHSTQELANAAETFISILGAAFPGDSFEQLFHRDTLRRAYWDALHTALEQYTRPGTGSLAQSLLATQVLAEPQSVRELLKLFLPGQQADYALVADLWAVRLNATPEQTARLTQEIETFYALLADELRRSPDLRGPLQQLVRGLETGLLGDDRSATAELRDQQRMLDSAVSSGPDSLPLQIRHLMALATGRGRDDRAAFHALTRIAHHLSPDALRSLWERVQDVHDDAERMRLVARLAPHLARARLVEDALALVQTALDEVAHPLDPALRARIFLELAPHLDTPGQTGDLSSFQSRVLNAALDVIDAASRVRALGALLEYLPVDLQNQAIEMALEAAACCIPSEYARANALSELPPHLPADWHTRLLDIAYELEDPDARAMLLGRMIPHLPQTLQHQALIGALNAIERISGDEARTQALIALAPYIDAIGPLHYLPEGLQQAMTVTFSITREDERARAFAALAPYLSPDLMTEALHAAKGIGDDFERARTLGRLAPHLSGDLHVLIYSIARDVPTPAARVAALSAIAPYLPARTSLQALANAMAAAFSIQERYKRVEALVDLAPKLPEDLKPRALTDALTQVRSIPDENERARALVFLAPHLMPEQLPDALADAYTILEPLERVAALSALMPYLPQAPRLRVAEDAIKLAQAVRPMHHKASILASIAPVIPDMLVDRALQVARLIDTPYDQLHVLVALLPRQPERLLDAALAAAHAVPDQYQRVSALLELIPHTAPALRQPLLDEALDTALGMRDEYDRASALTHLAPYMVGDHAAYNYQFEALKRAIDDCCAIPEMNRRALVMEDLAAVWSRLLTPAQSYGLWRQLVQRIREQPYPDVVTELAILEPVLSRINEDDAGRELAQNLLHDVFGA